MALIIDPELVHSGLGAMTRGLWRFRWAVVSLPLAVVLGVIVFGASQKSNGIALDPIRAQGRTAETLGIPPEANPELSPVERRIWLDGYMDARRAHLQAMGMLDREGDDINGKAENE